MKRFIANSILRSLDWDKLYTLATKAGGKRALVGMIKTHRLVADVALATVLKTVFLLLFLGHDFDVMADSLAHSPELVLAHMDTGVTPPVGESAAFRGRGVACGVVRAWGAPVDAGAGGCAAGGAAGSDDWDGCCGRLGQRGGASDGARGDLLGIQHVTF
ncbi:MAG: hypothetical protein Q9172_005133 [Xanthocarpia lactea]